MTEFDHIDDYLANRLSEQDKKAFEQRMEGDPALKEEVEFQQQVVKGVQQARIAELKTMLNQVPIGSSGWSAGQVAATVVSVAIVSVGLYFYFAPDADTTPLPETPKQELTAPVQKEEPKTAPASETKSEQDVKNTAPVLKSPAASRKSVIPAPVKKPAIEVVDPSEELKESAQPSQDPALRSEIQPSKLEVTTESTNKKYEFHYQFSEGKLILFGPFDENLFEILEIHGEGHAVFLFYRENYYLLDEKETKVTKLNIITDPQLLKKLKEYRGR